MKMILSDLDGTLLRPTENRISPKVLDAISSLYEKNIRFVIASGRAMSELRELFSTVQDKMCFVACDGALIFEGEQLLQAMPLENITQFDREESVLLQGRCMTYIKGSNAFVREMKLHYRGHATEYTNSGEIEETIYKAVVVSPKFEAEGVNVVYSTNRWTEYTAEGVDKGSATKFMLAHYGISPKEATAIGDNTNDIPMLRAVEHSVAVADAKYAVQRICKTTTDDVVKILRDEK